MIERKINKELLSLSKQYPIVSVTGARQCGKTTLIKNTFSNYDYINLEEPSTRQMAINEPTAFIGSFKNNLIIDEAQYVPDVFSSVQVLSDANEKPGRYILSGSQNFLLLKNITQSLAGRVGILKLPTLSYNEIINYDNKITHEQIITKGTYPRLYNSNIKSSQYYRDYIDTYIARDVKDLLDIKNTQDFKKMLRMLAPRTGQLLNYLDLANSLKIDQRTIKSWINILCSSYICFLLPPYASNIKKRLVKTPKLYFADTGLLSYLLDIQTPDEYHHNKYKGQIWENYIISEIYKHYSNANSDVRLFFYRDDNKVEVDLINQTKGSKYNLCEIKDTSLYKQKFKNNLLKVSNYLGYDASSSCVIYDGDICFEDYKVSVLNLSTYLNCLDN